MQLFKNRFVRFLYRHLAALLLIFLTRLILQPLESYLEIQLIALLFLLPVIASTVLWGLTPGILASFTAFLAFNYYYIPPYRTLIVHQAQNLITLIIFLIVAVILSQLIGQAREGMRLARSREREATQMYELIAALAGLQDAESVARILAEHTIETFHFNWVEITIRGNKDESFRRVSIPDVHALQGLQTFNIILATARGIEGEMHIHHQRQELTTEEKRLLETYASNGALALERIRLMKSEYKARILGESDRLKSSLLNSVSHELRSPLAAIKASVSSLRTGTVDWNIAARQDLLETIEEETDHLNFLVGNLLDMSRIESGALKPQLRWNSIEEIVLGVSIKMRKQLQDHHLEIDLPKNLPMIPTDYVQIEQVFTNLISNGIKYAPPGTTIAIAVTQESSYLHVRVANQGPHVAEEHLERIFDKFFRVTQADRITGTGLGLSICKGIVEAHGGKIWAENESQYFVFHFLLPLTLNGSHPEVPKETTDG